MKSIVISFSFLSLTLMAFGQETADSIEAQVLNEIVVEAPKVIRKADMDIYYPSKSAVENSKNGMQLLNNLMIPSMFVNDALGTVTAAGQSVQVRINGRQATVDQVRALLPETVKRVEWIENPSLIYNGANYVLNFIVTNPSLGGSLMLRAMPSLVANFGNYNGIDFLICLQLLQFYTFHSLKDSSIIHQEVTHSDESSHYTYINFNS